MLAFLSALRLHHVQAMMNLRQVLEAGAAAAYCIANPKVEDFVDIDEFGIMDPSKELTNKRYRWPSYAGFWVTAWIKRRTFLGSRLRFRRGILHRGRSSATDFVLAGAASFSPPP